MRADRRFVVGGLTSSLPFLCSHSSLGATAPSPIMQVRAKAGAISGTLSFAGATYHCMVGRSGILHPKYEGDGGTPAGTFPLREVRYRTDRVSQKPATALPVYPSKPNDGWCDDPEDPNYNRLVAMPYQTDAETMWRDDNVYDVLAVIGYNDAPTVPGAGSAIFLHEMHFVDGNPLPTTGCVSLKADDLLAVLAKSRPGTLIDIRAI